MLSVTGFDEIDTLINKNKTISFEIINVLLKSALANGIKFLLESNITYMNYYIITLIYMADNDEFITKISEGQGTADTSL